MWHSVLREEVTVVPDDVAGAWHIDIPGDGPESKNYLTYYADELIVVYPDDSRRSEIVALIEREAKPDTTPIPRQGSLDAPEHTRKMSYRSDGSVVLCVMPAI